MNFELSKMINQCDDLNEVKKNCLHKGDQVFLKTQNSVYMLNVDSDEQYIVSGGWFDKHNLSHTKVKINGCTWGGSIIKYDVIAACGLFLEFGNKLTTSKIQKIIIIPNNCRN
jgi:hypothetical protein